MYIPDGFIPDVETCRGASPTPTRQYVPRQYVPDVETCRDASLPRGGFHATDFTRRIYIPYIYIICISTQTNNCHYHT